MNQIHHGRPLFRIAHRRDVALGLVEQKIGVPLRALQKFSVHAHVIRFRIGLGAEFGDHGPVDLHVPRRDQLLRLPAGSDSGSSDNFLQPFQRHNELPNLSGTECRVRSNEVPSPRGAKTI